MDSKHIKSGTSSIILWGITGLLVLLFGMVLIYSVVSKGEDPVPRKKELANVEVMTVRTEEFREELTLPALIEADKVASIRSEFPGTLEKWLVDEGASVNRGQLVVKLNIDALMASLDELKASMRTASENVNLTEIAVESAELAYENAQKRARIQELALQSAESDLELMTTEFNRIETLFNRDIMYRSQLDTARNKLRRAELAVETAREGFESAKLDIRSTELQVRQAKTNHAMANARLTELNAAIANILVKVDKSNITAPISGRLESHLVEPGEVVAAAEPLAHIYDLRYLRAVIHVPDRFIAFLDPNNQAAKSFIRMNRPGSEQQVRAKVIIPGLPELTNDMKYSMEFEAEIAHIAQSSDPESNTFQVELRFSNPGMALKHGIIARGKIEYLHYPHAILIPAKSIQVTDIGPRVLVVESEGGKRRVRVRDIEPLSIHESEILIGKGLHRGDKLVVSGWKGLVGGEEVHVLVEDGRLMSKSTVSETIIEGRK